MSVRLRLALTYSLMMAALLGLGSAVLFVIMQDRLGADLDRRLQIRASEVRLAVWSEPGDPELEDLLPGQVDLSPIAELNSPGLYVQTLDMAGRPLATSQNLHGAVLPVDRWQYAPALHGRPAYANVTQPDGQEVRVLSVPVVVNDEVAAVLQLGESLQPIQDVLARLRWALLTLGSAGMLAGAVGGWCVADRALRPLSVMSSRAAIISTRRDFERRLNLAGTDEVGQLARVIDQLLETVDHTLRSHHDFVADISHELRNPLLAIRANVDLLDGCADEAERQECVSEIRDQVQRLTRLVGDLLLLAQVEPRQIIEQRPVGLAPLVRRVAREVERRAPAHTVRAAHIEPLQILGDEDRIVQILTNLAGNALQHTEPGGTITLSVTRESQMACLVVEDAGGGIDPEHLPHIFDRNYSVSATSRSRGNGLGLAIVKHLAEAHGGSVEVESQPGQGSRFIVRLPLSGPPSARSRSARKRALPVLPAAAAASVN